MSSNKPNVKSVGTVDFNVNTASGLAGYNKALKASKETKPTKPPKTKAEKRQENFKKAATIVSGLSDLAGRLKDPGLNYTPSATSVKSGASRGASYINSFDEYDTEKGGVNG